jgi:hypothetical protein
VASRTTLSRRFGTGDTGTICRLLADPETTGSWLQMFLVDLAGTRRLTEAIPTLVDMLRGDGGSLPENCSEALARIGHPKVVRRVPKLRGRRLLA